MVSSFYQNALRILKPPTIIKTTLRHANTHTFYYRKPPATLRPAEIWTGHPDNPKKDGTKKTVSQEVKAVHADSLKALKLLNILPKYKLWPGYDGDRAPGKAPGVVVTATAMNTQAMMSILKHNFAYLYTSLGSEIEDIKTLSKDLGVYAKLLAAHDTIYKPNAPQVDVYNKQFWIDGKSANSYIKLKESYTSSLKSENPELERQKILDRIHKCHNDINKTGKQLYEKLNTNSLNTIPYYNLSHSFKPTLALAQPRLCANETETTLKQLMTLCNFKCANSHDEQFKNVKEFFTFISSEEGKMLALDKIKLLNDNDQNNINLFQLYASMGDEMVSELVTANTQSASQVASAMCLAKLFAKDNCFGTPIKPLYENLDVCQNLSQIYTDLLKWDTFKLTAKETYLRFFLAMSDMTLQPGFAAGRVGIKFAVKDVSDVAAKFEIKQMEVTLGQGSSSVRGDLGGNAELNSLSMPVNKNVKCVISKTLQTNKRERILNGEAPSYFKDYKGLLTVQDQANNPAIQTQLYNQSEGLDLLRSFFKPSVSYYHKMLEPNSEFMTWVLNNELPLASLKQTADIKGGSRDGTLVFDSKFSFLNQRAITAGILAKTLGIPLSFFGVAHAIIEDKKNGEPLFKKIKENHENSFVKQNLEELRIVLAEINFDLFEKYDPPKELIDKFKQEYNIIDEFYKSITGRSIKSLEDPFISEVVSASNQRARYFKVKPLGSLSSRVKSLKTSYPPGTYAYHTSAGPLNNQDLYKK